MDQLYEEVNKYVIKDITNIIIHYYSNHNNYFDEYESYIVNYLGIQLHYYTIDGNYIMIEHMLKEYDKLNLEKDIIDIDYALSNSDQYPKIKKLLTNWPMN